MPKLNNNDETYTLIEWLVEPGCRVGVGDAVATVETSKAAEELTSAGEGLLHQLVPVGTECAVGELIGRLSGTAPPTAAPVQVSTSDVILTEPARRLIAERGIDPATVAALGRRVVRTSDLIDSRISPLPTVQQAVAAVVTESHRAIPAGFVAITVPVDRALARARELTREHRRLIGLPELVVKAIGGLREDFPYCFAAFVEPGSVLLAGRVDVGVTIDVGKGLQVPVVRDVAGTSLSDVAKALMSYRLTAMRGTFRAADLTDATILLALHTDDDVSLAVPIVLPGTVCAVSLAGIQRQVDLDDDGQPVVRTVVQLGLAYDHRVINGREAVEFLRAIRSVLTG